MRNIFLPLFLFQMSYALFYVSIDKFEISYSLTFENSCYSEEERFQIMLGLSITKCVKECGARPHCRALNFRRKINVCELFSTLKADQPRIGDCILVKKNDIAVTKSPCQLDCKYGEVCENIGKENGTCKIKECVNSSVPEYDVILGNQRDVGKQIIYKTAGVKCLPTGVWSDFAKDVRTPTIGQNCSNNLDCIETEGICIEGKCFCNRLYQYNASMEDCTKVCESMSTDFEVFHGLAIIDYNDVALQYTADTVDGCKFACINEYDCLSIDVWWNLVGKAVCNMGSVTREMILDADPQKLQNQNTKLYTRICN